MIRKKEKGAIIHYECSIIFQHQSEKSSFAVSVRLHLCPPVEQGLVQGALVPGLEQLPPVRVVQADLVVLELLELLHVVQLHLPQRAGLLGCPRRIGQRFLALLVPAIKGVLT